MIILTEKQGESSSFRTLKELKEIDKELSSYAWRRYLAKIVDINLFGIFFGFSMEIIGYGDFIFATNEILLGVILRIGFGFFEALLLYGFGTTIGKKIAGIKIINTNGNNLSYFEALVRYIGFFVKGIYFGIKGIFLIGAFIQYRNLVSEKYNYNTSYDTENITVLYVEEINIIRLLLLVVGSFGINIIITFFSQI